MSHGCWPSLIELSQAEWSPRVVSSSFVSCDMVREGFFLATGSVLVSVSAMVKSLSLNITNRWVQVLALFTLVGSIFMYSLIHPSAGCQAPFTALTVEQKRRQKVQSLFSYGSHSNRGRHSINKI